MDHDEQAKRIARLLAELESTSPQGEGLDPNDVARLAAGRPPESVRAAIEAGLGDEDAAITAAIATMAGARRRPPIRWRMQVAVAALVMVALGGWLLLGGSRPKTRTDADLVTAFAALVQAEPQVFAGVEPLLAAERSDGAATVQRGGLQGVGPRGTLLDPRPTLRWGAVSGASAYEVEVISDAGVSALTLTSESAGLAWPDEAAPLDDGVDYILRVASAAAGVRIEGSSAFRVADARERARYQRALVAIDAVVPSDLRAIVRAQTALRMDLLDEAHQHLAATPPAAAERLATATAACVERRRGQR